MKVDGGEAEIQLVPTRELRITANATYLKSRFGSFPRNAFYIQKTVTNTAPATATTPAGNPCIADGGTLFGGNTLCFGPATGNRTPLSPRFAVSLGANYTLPVGENGELIFNALLNRTSLVYFEADNRLKQPAFTVINGAIEYRPQPNWGVEFFVNNLTDKQYYIVGASGTTGDHGDWPRPGPMA